MPSISYRTAYSSPKKTTAINPAIVQDLDKEGCLSGRLINVLLGALQTVKDLSRDSALENSTSSICMQAVSCVKGTQRLLL
jgi:hypothetical protein